MSSLFRKQNIAKHGFIKKKVKKAKGLEKLDDEMFHLYLFENLANKKKQGLPVFPR